MRIAVVGGGAAGLVTAWLLEQEHEVTLFESADRLGGHAHTVEIEVDGQRLAIDAGFQFFGPGRAYATFNRLLDHLGVAREIYPATMTLHRSAEGGSVALPPWRDGRPVGESLTPAAIVDLVRFRRFLSGIPAFLARHDTSITIDEYIRDRRMPASFVDRFLYPLLLALWCLELEEFRGFSAYNALYYLGESLTDGYPPTQSQIVGGMKTYIDALAASLSRARVVLGARVERVSRDEGGYVVEGERFDQVVIATNARLAHGMLEGVSAADRLREKLVRIEYFDTTIAVHGDRSLMPERTAAWSVVNARWDGIHSQLSIWTRGHGLPVFRSWVTFQERMPEPLYAVATYEHGKVTPAYFDAQRRLGELHGHDGVWLAGLYMGDADSHESAVLSAVAIAERLAPRSERFRMLRP
ncbi:FAD-dependent oxidoreductase [Microbacterium aoyamense]|uniref:FAD-dependent oxidoreductase n=1 Tax=Microbacterium aoyamense TaxID=344166 RepID=A0ABN2PFH7_9MICO|nr:FAD-dependent oxidoreductase [Microbacterium aoyamense]